MIQRKQTLFLLIAVIAAVIAYVTVSSSRRLAAEYALHGNNNKKAGTAA